MSTIQTSRKGYPAKLILTMVILFLFASAEFHTLADGSGETAESEDHVALNGTWDGLWISPTRGWIYAAELHLNVDSRNNAQGHIKWTLKQSPHGSEQAKIGLTGIEYVSGKYDPRARILSVDGKRKDDPHTILGLDRYRLILAENRIALGGITENHGTWRGMFSAGRRAEQ